MPQPDPVQALATVLFGLALIHTFSTRFFEHLAHTRPAHAGLWHLLGEVEVVFGFWAMVLIIGIFMLAGRNAATDYVDTRDFTEPMFVFAIMVVAGSRPVLHAATACVDWASGRVPGNAAIASYCATLALVPLLGSLITEPAAMTLAALILRQRCFAAGLSSRFKYATVGVLFVNVSIGGTLTPFAAPPVLMVAGTWGWDTGFMLANFGARAVPAVMVNAVVLAWLFRGELNRLPEANPRTGEPVPLAVTVVHLLFLAGIVAFAHHPGIFLGLMLFFIGFAHAYARYQDRLILREGLLVAFFLAGLVVLGGQQAWWLKPLLLAMSADQVYYGATALTALTDNAALTYLGSLVDGLSSEFKVALVAGAVTGGGLTIVANAPNPAGFAILKEHLEDQALNPLGLLAAALPPTLVTILAFRLV